MNAGSSPVLRGGSRLRFAADETSPHTEGSVAVPCDAVKPGFDIAHRQNKLHVGALAKPHFA